MIELTTITAFNNYENFLNICVDVSKYGLDSYVCIPDGQVEHSSCDSFKNNNTKINQALDDFKSIGKQFGFEKLRVICEPTGGYEDKLLRLARAKGFYTAYVSGEASAKARAICSNDGVKSDPKDAKSIAKLAEMNALLTARSLDEQYDILRSLGLAYEDENDAIVVVKNKINNTIEELFCDYSRKAGTYYSKTSRTIVDLFGFNPYKIAAVSLQRFIDVVRTESKYARTSTLTTIWNDAKSSALLQRSAASIQLLEERLVHQLKVLDLHEAEKTLIAKRMEAIYEKTEEYKKLSQIDDLNPLIMARILAETGPLKDFKHPRALLRYAGLNLKMRQSGKFEGKRKISKKGRILLRKVLYQAVFSNLLKEGKMYHELHKKKSKELGSGMKSITCLMRKLLKTILGVARSKEDFDKSRVFICAFEYEKLQAAS